MYSQLIQPATHTPTHPSGQVREYLQTEARTITKELDQLKDALDELNALLDDSDEVLDELG